MARSGRGKVLSPHQEAGDDSRGRRCARLAQAPGKWISDQNQQAPPRSHGREAPGMKTLLASRLFLIAAARHFLQAKPQGKTSGLSPRNPVPAKPRVARQPPMVSFNRNLIGGLPTN